MIKRTYNPILKEEAYKVSFFPRIPMPGQNSVIVLIPGDNIRQSLCIRPGANIRPAELKKADYSRLVEIDTSSQYIEMEFTLLSKDNVSNFILTASMSVTVSDPIAFLEERVTDAGQRIETELKPLFQEMADRFEIEEISMFRETARHELSHFTLTRCGFTLSGCNINVRGDKHYQEYLRKEKEISQNVKLEKKKAESAMQIAELYEDPLSAVFSEVAENKITPVEALAKIRENRAADFETKMKQVERVGQVIKNLRDSGLVSEEQVQQKLEPLLGEIVSGSMSAGQGQIAASEQKGITDNAHSDIDAGAFAAFDDD